MNHGSQEHSLICFSTLKSSSLAPVEWREAVGETGRRQPTYSNVRERDEEEMEKQPLSKPLKLGDCHSCCCQKWKSLNTSIPHFLPLATLFYVVCVVLFKSFCLCVISSAWAWEEELLRRRIKNTMMVLAQDHQKKKKKEKIILTHSEALDVHL